MTGNTPEIPTMREYTLMTHSQIGSTEAVTTKAHSAQEARQKVLKLGYHQILWTIPTR